MKTVRKKSNLFVCFCFFSSERFVGRLGVFGKRHLLSDIFSHCRAE
uniref:Uncharacterized protein n=1 Tax=Anguilla anguilla TaxID=7936 RepID=A0A0E9WCY0_ANGAN